MRHAKSDWDAPHDRDRDRPLNERGARSARVIGRLLAAEDLVPDLVVSSPATRAATTAAIAADAGGWPCEIRHDERLYSRGPDGVLEAIAEVPDVGRLLVVGHQPTWGMLARRLTGERVEVRTATVVVAGLPIHRWEEAGTAAGSLVAVHHPRDQFGTSLDR